VRASVAAAPPVARLGVGSYPGLAYIQPITTESGAGRTEMRAGGVCSLTSAPGAWLVNATTIHFRRQERSVGCPPAAMGEHPFLAWCSIRSAAAARPVWWHDALGGASSASN